MEGLKDSKNSEYRAKLSKFLQNNNLDDLYHGDWPCYLQNGFVPIEGLVILNEPKAQWELKEVQCLVASTCHKTCIRSKGPTVTRTDGLFPSSGTNLNRQSV